MRKLITTLVFLMLGSVAMAQNNNMGSSSSTPRGTVPEAPVGHRQPRADQVPSEKNLSNPNDPVNREDAALDKKRPRLALEMSELRALSTMALGGAPGPEVSKLKIRGSEIQQRITELTMEAVGEYSAPYLPGLLWQGSNEEPVGPEYAHLAAPRYFNTRKTTIYGGSNEIQKGIISKMVLGL